MKSRIKNKIILEDRIMFRNSNLKNSCVDLFSRKLQLVGLRIQIEREREKKKKKQQPAHTNQRMKKHSHAGTCMQEDITIIIHLHWEKTKSEKNTRNIYQPISLEIWSSSSEWYTKRNKDDEQVIQMNLFFTLFFLPTRKTKKRGSFKHSCLPCIPS